MTSGFEQISVSVDGRVGRIRLNRPERHNAQTEIMWRELAEAGRQLSVDSEVSVVILSGEGRSFSSGIDLDEMKPGGFIARLAAHPAGQPDPMNATIAVAQESIRWIRDAPFLVMAAVHGKALGAGCQLALAADIRVIESNAELALREVEYGLIPDLGATASLPRLVGTERALDLILTGRTLSGVEAVDAGIALQACEPGTVGEVADAYAQLIARNTRTAVAYGKAAVHADDFARSLALAGAGQAACIRERSDFFS